MTLRAPCTQPPFSNGTGSPQSTFVTLFGHPLNHKETNKMNSHHWSFLKLKPSFATPPAVSQETRSDETLSMTDQPLDPRIAASIAAYGRAWIRMPRSKQ
jgi:hypothetical protein